MFLAIIPPFLYLLVKERRRNAVREAASGRELPHSGRVVQYFDEGPLRHMKEFKSLELET
jgi:hypothetical protein